ncbi:hypothetical protein TanjilG_16454 [Lupinus angustifolius]|uniref:Uncharacterized protein n=1 Tax=Lupinus angustifolius TaxID=3871 RepID=A0A1J7HLS9_LUPAN|nr:hypothetical protein TanjilG_16454 [Lupinus angustifolius]
MKHKQLPKISAYIDHFTSFENILHAVATTSVLVDVIGEFVDLELSHPKSIPKKVIFIMRN